ncbi:hypothetical protein LMG31506_04617 [Cupriavidus yeoncheonensis]|uniref:Uncharacterized protein n=1 Tax=Cupriavidus yeoncheonensis TaxID=1462994 RepID=A0A916IXM9_9BURK|nr:hypothetical protein LMG31506_04617 [Cupriavidus yeoncheonensis]
MPARHDTATHHPHPLPLSESSDTEFGCPRLPPPSVPFYRCNKAT